MDGQRFDDLARRLAAGAASRRGLLRGLLGGLAGLAAGAAVRPPAAEAQCVAANRPCTPASTCCAPTVCQGGLCRCPACGPDQIAGPNCSCLCRTSGRPPDPVSGCPCPPGQVRCNGVCRQCCTDAHCTGVPCVNGVCGCPAGQKLCGTGCIPSTNCCTDADCADADPCTIGTCQSGGCVQTYAGDGASCGAGLACCTDSSPAGHSCVATAGFCPPEQTFQACLCSCDNGETKCGVECCVDASETCLGGTASGSCCPSAKVCVNGTTCCGPTQACCADACVETATFCPVEQTFSDCQCICASGTLCGPECCTAQETCIDAVSDFCCPSAKACVGNTVCCPGSEICESGACCLPLDAGTCSSDADCCADLWCDLANGQVCRAVLANNQNCERAAQCQSDFCCPSPESVCGADTGQVCAADSDCCGDDWCTTGQGTVVCAAALGAGEVCTRAAQCGARGCCAVDGGDDVCGVAESQACDPLAAECCPGLACRGTAGSETCQPNLPPVADPQTVANSNPVKSGDEDPITITLTGSDPNSDPLTFAIVTGLPAGGGTLGAIVPVDATSATVEYTPPATSIAGQTVSFTFKVNDGTVDSPPATVEIQVFEEAPDVTYTTVGNTELVTSGFTTPVTTPHVTATDGVLAGTTTLTVNEPSPITTTQGGTVSMESDGEFDYRPPAGFTGTDTFDYEVNWGGTGTVTITVGTVVWYVNNAGSDGDGRSHSPFNTLAGAETASDPGEVIFVHRGDSGTTAYDGGITLKANQQLIGEGVGLTVDTIALVSAGSRPQLTNSGGAAIALASNNTVRGLDVVGTGGSGIVGTGIGTFAADAIDVSRTGGPALNLETGTVSATFGALSATTSSGRGLRLVGLAGSLSATSGSISGASAGAVLVDGGNAAITYPGSVTNEAGPAVEITNRTGGTLSFSGAITDSGASNAGITLASNAGTINFTGAVTLTDTTAAALAITGGTAVIDFDDLTISQTNGQPGIAASNVAGGSLTVTGSGGINVSGSGAGNDAITFDGTGNAFDVSLAAVSINSNAMRHGLVLGDLGSGSDVTITSGTITAEGNGRRVVSFAAATDGTFNLAGVTLNGNTSDGIALGATQLGTYQFGNLDVNTPNAAAPTSGIGVQVSGTSAAVTFASIDQTGGATAIAVTNLLTGGSVTVNGGAIASTTVAGVDINQGTGTISLAPSITNTAGRTAQIQNRTGGSVTLSGNLNGGGTGLLVKDNTTGSSTITFSGASKAFSTGTNAAVTLDNNDGATIAFSNGGLAITTTSGTGFDARNGAAAINVTTGLNPNTISAGSGTALSVVNSTIGVSGLTFRSIAAGGGANNGIVLDNTGNNSGLTVTGTGGAGTGGTIANKTGANGASTAGIGIYLNQTRNVSLSWMQLNNFDNFAIRGVSVTGFTLTNSVINATGGAFNGNNFSGTPTDGSNLEGSISFFGLTGTASITSSTVSRGFGRNFAVDNDSGTLNLTIDGCTIEDTNGSTGDDGISVELGGSSTGTIVITDNTLRRHGGDHVNLSLLGSAVASLVVARNVLTGGHPIGLGQGIFVLGASFDGSLTYNISNNGTNAVPFTGNKQGGAIHVNKGSGTGTFSGVIENNVIGDPAVTGSGSEQAFGIIVGARGAGGSHTTLINNNSVRQYFDRGIVLEAGEGGAALNATVTNNAVSNFADSVNSLHGIHSDNGINVTDTNQVCMDIRSNLVATAGNEAAGGADIRLRKGSGVSVRLPGLTGAMDATAAQALIDANNPDATTVTVTNPGGTAFGGGGTCAQPTPPTIPS